MMVYPCKMPVLEHLREGAYPNTLFASSETGGMHRSIQVLTSKCFTNSILLIELIELARSNDVHIFCLPANTSHLLQPLDVGVFKAFKSNFTQSM